MAECVRCFSFSLSQLALLQYGRTAANRKKTAPCAHNRHARTLSTHPPTDPPAHPRFAQFEAAIAAVLGQDNAARAAAEAALEQFKANADAFVVGLTQLLLGSQDASVRVLAGVLLRQQLDNRNQCWDRASEGARAQVRQSLLQLLTRADEPRTIRRTVAEAIGSLAVQALPQNAWPEFLPSVFQMAASPVAAHRISVALILGKLIEWIPQHVQAHLEQIRGALFQSLGDANPEVTGGARITREPCWPAGG
jgi:hypothetical protein